VKKPVSSFVNSAALILVSYRSAGFEIRSGVRVPTAKSDQYPLTENLLPNN
jgi:hypothetical protein